MSAQTPGGRVIAKSAGIVTVSTPVTLYGFVDMTTLGAFKRVCVGCVNLDPTNNLYMVLDESIFGVYPDPAVQQIYTVPPLSEATQELGPFLARPNLRLSFHTQGPGYPTVQMQWAIVSDYLGS